MVFTRLPFATTVPATCRAVATYRLAQYFRQRHGMMSDWELTSLSRAYDDIRHGRAASGMSLANERYVLNWQLGGGWSVTAHGIRRELC